MRERGIIFPCALYAFLAYGVYFPERSLGQVLQSNLGFETVIHMHSEI
jgi:hypothetical protein